MCQIYGAVIGGHLSTFPSDIRRFGGPVLQATISLHRSVCAKFLPTAVKFYYGFNLRDMSCLVQVPPITHVLVVLLYPFLENVSKEDGVLCSGRLSSPQLRTHIAIVRLYPSSVLAIFRLVIVGFMVLGTMHGKTRKLLVEELAGSAVATRVRESLLRQVCKVSAYVRRLSSCNAPVGLLFVVGMLVLRSGSDSWA